MFRHRRIATGLKQRQGLEGGGCRCMHRVSDSFLTTCEPMFPPSAHTCSGQRHTLHGPQFLITQDFFFM
ncbi:hypothetical protein C0J52_21958 [Blattella germanica]|nr:hypothetical protein C0J52_21958 [Blattella germanica]